MYTTFCNATPLAFNCVRLPSPRQPKHRATFCHRLRLRQKASARDWYPRPDACRGSAWRTNHCRRRKKRKKEEGNWRRWEKLYNSSGMLQPGLVVRLCKWEAPSSIAALDLFTMGTAYNESSKLIEVCGFCMWPCRWRRAWEKRSLRQLLRGYRFSLAAHVELPDMKLYDFIMSVKRSKLFTRSAASDQPGRRKAHK